MTQIGQWELDSIQHADLFALCDGLPDASVDLILADLPYGTTSCHWDTVIPFAPMWERFKRVIKPRGAIVLTASQPFTSALVMSNVEWFKYSWVWDKVAPTGHLNVKLRPMRQHDDVLVFSVGSEPYYPQFRNGVAPHKTKGTGNPAVYGKFGENRQTGIGYPVSIVRFMRPGNFGVISEHPTQKPVELFEYLIRTYTREGDLVLDPCVGSGTTALAARNCGRHWLCGDQSAEYVAVARDRLRMPFEPRQVPQNDDVSHLPMFAAAQP